MKEKDLALKEARSSGYPTQTITDANYTNDIVLLAITPAHTKSLLHSLQQAASGIGLYVNLGKTE